MQFELSWYQTPPARPPQTHTQTHRQDRLQYTAPLASAQCNQRGMLSSFGWMALKMKRPTDDRRTPSKIHILTDVSVADILEWLWGHQQDNVLHSIRTVHGLPLTERLSTEPVSLSIFGRFWRLRSFQPLTWNSFSNFCTVYPLSWHNFLNQNVVFFFKGDV